MRDGGFDLRKGTKIKRPGLFTPFRTRRSIRPPQFEGCVHQLSIHHATGWARDRANPGNPVTVEAVMIVPEGERVLSHAVADAYYGPLSLQSFEDVRHGFQLIFDPPLSDAERDAAVIRPAGTPIRLEFATSPDLPADPYPDERIAPIEGFIDELSLTGVSGWMVNRRDLSCAVDFEVVLAIPGENPVTIGGRADQPHPGLKDPRFGDANRGFKVKFPAPLTPYERDSVIVRPAGQDYSLPRAPEFQGVVDDLNAIHAIGWVRNRFRQEDKLAVEAVLLTRGGKRRLATGIAELFHEGLALGVPEDGYHGFRLCFAPPLEPDEPACVSIRLSAFAFTLPVAAPEQTGPSFIGYIDEVSLNHVSGWVLDVHQRGTPVAFEVVTALDSENRVIATGMADRFYAPLQSNHAGDAEHGFRLAFLAPLTTDERDSLIVRPLGHDLALPRAPGFQGFVDELDAAHAMGWVRNRFHPERKLAVEAVLLTPDGERQLATGIAGAYHEGLAAGAPEDAEHGFRLSFEPSLTPEQRDTVIVRLLGVPFTLHPETTM